MPRAIPFAKRAAIAVDYESGMKRAEIMDKHGVSKTLVTKVCHEFGLAQNRRKRGLDMSDDLAERIRAARDDGMSCQAIADEFGTTFHGVRKALGLVKRETVSGEPPSLDEIIRLNEEAAAERMSQPLFWEGGSRGASSLWQETVYG